jgi:hypothetical protein
MFEYAAVAGGGIQDWWTGQMLPFWDMLRASDYFWPGVAAAALLFVFVVRQLAK